MAFFWGGGRVGWVYIMLYLAPLTSYFLHCVVVPSLAVQSYVKRRPSVPSDFRVKKEEIHLSQVLLILGSYQ